MYRTCAFYAKKTGRYLGFCADGEAFCVRDTDTDVHVRKYASALKFPEKEQRRCVGETDAHITIPHMTISSGE